jgi:hypothetical protein
VFLFFLFFNLEGLPSTKFLANIKPNSMVIIDDQFDEAVNSPDVARAFKIDRRHKKFTIALITQVRLTKIYLHYQYLMI